MSQDDQLAGHGDKPDKDKGANIFIDGKKFDVTEPYLNGAQLKALAGVPSEYQLFLEQSGDDKQIGDAESIKLKNGMHFYSVPPATFGA